jgi:hypothetical protein
VEKKKWYTFLWTSIAKDFCPTLHDLRVAWRSTTYITLDGDDLFHLVAVDAFSHPGIMIPRSQWVPVWVLEVNVGYQQVYASKRVSACEQVKGRKSLKLGNGNLQPWYCYSCGLKTVTDIDKTSHRISHSSAYRKCLDVYQYLGISKNLLFFIIPCAICHDQSPLECSMY